MSKRLIVVLAVVWIVLLVAGTSSSLTLTLCGVATGEEGRDKIVVYEDEYEMIERYSKLQEVMDIVKRDYYIEVDEETLITGALQGMLAALEDPYTFYYTPEEMAETMEHQDGTYVGVGMQVLSGENGDMIITRTFKGSSAQEAGLRAGDCVRAVNGEPVDAITVQNMNEAVEKIKGTPGTEVTLMISRDGVLMDFVLERRKINMNRVEYRMLQDDIGYIMLYEFMGDDVEGVSEALNELKKQGMKGLVFDVRSNPGGLLEDVVRICDMLLPKGTIVYIENRAGERETYYSDSKALGIPLVVLVNEMSASASEILAGSVQDAGAGTIVGKTTFGKGIVQMVLPFPEDGSGMQLTTAVYYTASGRSIHGNGIEPDVTVDDEGYDINIAQPDPEADPQLREAVRILREEIGR